jgi:hypothetical protein
MSSFTRSILDVPRADLPNGKTVMAAPHALQYLPYTYEGLTPEQRKTLRAADIAMRLIVFPRSCGQCVALDVHTLIPYPNENYLAPDGTYSL